MGTKRALARLVFAFVLGPVGNAFSQLPLGWQSADIGDPGLAGSCSYDTTEGIFIVTGGGADIWETWDQFHYVHQSRSGDFMITARVLSMDQTDGWAKAGVMVRGTLDGNSEHAMMMMTPKNGATFQWRSETGGVMDHRTQAGLLAPYWVRIVRKGTTFKGFASEDGFTWMLVGVEMIPDIPAVDALVGLAVTSHNPGALCTAQFDNVSIEEAPPVGPCELVGYWSFDEGSGDIAYDASGYDNHGMVTEPFWHIGPAGFGGALQFDGQNYVEILNSQVFDITNAITLAAWIKVDLWDRDWQTIFCRGDWSWRLARNSLAGQNNQSVSFHMTGMDDGWGANGTVTVTDDQWHHVAGTWDGARAKIYIDGVLNDDQPRTGAIGIAGDDPVAIGAQIHNGQLRRQFVGCIDDVRLYNCALSQAEVSGLLCSTFLPQDLNQDCYVNMLDFAMFATGWLSCTNPRDPTCIPSQQEDKGAIVLGTFYGYETLDQVKVVFPQRLGGETQTTAFVGKPVLFIEDPPPSATEARIWISSIEYEVSGISFTFDINGDGDLDRVETGPFILSRLSPVAWGLDEPPGKVDLASGAFDLTYVVHIDMPLPDETGIGDLGVFVENVSGVIDLETGIQEIGSSSVRIESEFFDGTEVLYDTEEIQSDGITISCSKRPPVPMWKKTGLTFWIPRDSGTCTKKPDNRCVYKKYISGLPCCGHKIVDKGVRRAHTDYDTFIKKYSSGKNWGFLAKNDWGWTKHFNGLSPIGWWEVQYWKSGQKCVNFPSHAVIQMEDRYLPWP